MTVPVPRSEALPADTLLLDGPTSLTAMGGPEGVLTAVGKVLERPGPAVVVATSGSTGRPKRTVLNTASLLASAHATQEHLHGPGQWLLCLPAYYVAGIQVLVRSAVARTAPVVMADDHFTAAGFARTADRMTGPVRYVSLVPTQLQRLVDAHENPAVLAALRSFSAVLLGGSAASSTLLDRARALGARVVTTYGMSETSGGCVYDGVALPGVHIRIEPESPGHSVGRIWLGGAVVTDGYLDDDAQTARHVFTEPPASAMQPLGHCSDDDGADARETAAAVRWYRTDDLGEITARAPVSGASATLRVIGRADDVIVSGGLKLSAGTLRREVLKDQRVEDAVVLGLPDPEWGQQVVALVIPAPEAANDRKRLTEDLSARVRAGIGAAAVPKQWRTVASMPLLPTGKPDLVAIRELFTDGHHAPSTA